MKARLSYFAWPIVGLGAVTLSVWLLLRQLRHLSIGAILTSLERVPPHHWAAAAAATLCAYAALAGYDRIALRHLGRRLPIAFVSITSFTAYALSHNIGFSVLSSAVVRFRAYTSRGVSAAEVGVVVAFCSFTFTLGTIVLGGIVLAVNPELADRYVDLPPAAVRTAGIAMLCLVAFYVIGSLFHLKPLTIGTFALRYPRPEIVARQLIIGPVEILAAAAIIYFSLPEAGNPGYFTVLGIFLASFSLALVSHAPGGLGVLEFLFLNGLPEMNPADVLAALIIFRLFYLLIPLALSLVVVVLFERRQLARGPRK